MTQEEREAGNEVVARGMGYVFRVADMMWYSPDGTPRFSPPDLYANTDAGAMARERAETNLLRVHHIRLITGQTAESIWMGTERGNYLTQEWEGFTPPIGHPTLAEARAHAIIAAFQAISEGNLAE